MNKLRLGPLLAVAGVAGLLGAMVSATPGEDPPQFGNWSTATPVGDPIWNADTEGCPFISKSGLDLFFRQWIYHTPTTGSYDIYVSHRDTPDDPWEPEVSLGPNINSGRAELCSFLSIDGHWLYFVSSRTGSYGTATDLWVAHRTDKRNDSGWEPPVNLGTSVNTTAQETGPSLFEDPATGEMVLYFTRVVAGKNKIYSCRMLDPQTPEAPAQPVVELNSDGNHAELHAFVRRKDGLEVIFASDRDSTTANIYDLYVSTRVSTSDAWSVPTKLGPEINSARSEARPSISWDGTTLYFWSDRTWVPDPTMAAGGWWAMHVYQATRANLTGPK